MEKQKIQRLPLSQVIPPDEPDRIEISPEEISELAESIKAMGLLQPILVVKREGVFEVVAGHRRYLAHLKAGLSEIDCIVRDMQPDEVALLRATENLSRQDLTPVEEARIYSRLHEKYGLPWESIGKKFGKSPGLIKRRSDILRMPEELQTALHKKQITVGVAEELWRITDITALTYYLSFAVENGVTVAVARQWAQDFEKQARGTSTDVEGGGGFRHPYEQQPIYVSCDSCRGPVDLSKMSTIRVCPDCAALITALLEQYKKSIGG